MALTSSTNKITYNGDGSTTDFALPYLVYDTTHVQVYVNAALQSTGYTVSGIGDPSGVTITFAPAPALNANVTLQRVVPLTQLAIYDVAGAFPAKTTEKNFDLSVMRAQQHETARLRSLRQADGDGADIATLPLLATRANKYLTFDASGNPVASDPATASGTSVLATGSTTARLLANRFGEIRNVLDYGAVGDGVTDDQPAIAAAITAASDGDTIYFPRPTSFYSVGTTITVAKRLHLLGSFAYGSPTSISGSQIRGSGFTIFKMEEPFLMENLAIYDATGHASTIGVDINDGATGVVKWTIKNCTINCTTGSYGTLGTGIRCVFALTGVIENSTIEGWLNGIDLQASGGLKSNANKISGNKIRQNTIGILQTSAEGVYVAGNTIEGNSTGLKILTGKCQVISNHFENTLGNQRQIHVLDGNLVSIANGFYSSTGADKDIYIEAGTGPHISFADTLNAGVKHNGGGMLSLHNPILVPIVSGTGQIVRVDGNGITNLQGSPNLLLTPGGDIKWGKPLVSMGGGSSPTLGTIGGAGPATAGQDSWLRLLDSTGASIWLPVWK